MNALNKTFFCKIVFLFLPLMVNAQCPTNYVCNTVLNTITFQFDAGNSANDRNIACDFVRMHGGSGTDPCSGGSIFINGVQYNYTGNDGGGSGGNSPITLTYTATTDITVCPSNMEIGLAIGCGFVSQNGCLRVRFEDVETGQNCSSSNSYFRMIVEDLGNCGPYTLSTSGNSTLGFPTSGITTGDYTSPTIKASNYIFVFKDALNREYTYIYNHITEDGSCVVVSSLNIVKTITSGNPFNNGGIIGYKYAVTSTGNINGPITIYDDKICNPSCAAISYLMGDDGDNILEPGETWMYTGNYTSTSQDFLDGCVVNQAYATNGTIFSDVVSVKAMAVTCTPLSYTFNTTNVSCNGASTGNIDLTVTGGTMPYTYDWSHDGPESPDNDTQDLSGLKAGIYTVTVTDANGCTSTVGVTITQPTAVSISVASQTNVSCNGGNNGSVTFTTIGGTGMINITPAATGLSAGSYTFTATDANGCTSTVGVTITQPTAVSISVASQTNVSCNGGNNGSVTFTTIGGTGTINITPATTGLSAGSYTFTATDANGCTSTVGVTITQPTAVSISVASQTNVSCNGGNNGSVTFTTSGGTGTINITPATTGLSAGNYTFTATDANGCTSTVGVTITQPTAALAITLDGKQNVLCHSGNNGSINISVSGGTGTITYDWSNDGAESPDNDTQDLSGLSVAGTYSVTVTDANSCSVSASYEITNDNMPITFMVMSENVSCVQANNGSIEVVGLNGGVGPFSYSIGLGEQNSPVFANLGVGSYTITVTDYFGCKKTADAEISMNSCGLEFIKEANWNDENSISNAEVGETIEFTFTLTNTKNSEPLIIKAFSLLGNK